MLGTEIPPSWRKISLGKVLQTRKQKDIPSSFPGLPYIGMEHVVRDIGLIDSFGSSSDYRSSAPRVYEGDVLYGRLRPYLNKVVISPCEAFASGEFIVLPPNNEIMGKFLQLRLLCQDFVEFAGTLDTGDRPRVSWEQISQFELALPPIDEQIKMISILEDHLSRLDVAVKLADAMEKQSFILRRSLLQAAFTGQLTNEVVSV
jgi:type I restriction enzyme S subunit